jgi:DNA repair protein RadD
MITAGCYTLRVHQEKAVVDTRAALRMGRRRVIIQGPCGFGKTIVAVVICSLAQAKHKRVLVLADSRQLVYQMSEKLTEAEIPHSMLMAGEDYSMSSITIASKQTLWSRAYKKERIMAPRADIVIVDEAHKSLTTDWQEILKDYSDSHIIGLTATPEGCGGYYEEIIPAGKYSELIPEFLAPCRVFAPWALDLTGCPRSDGDYNMSEVGRRFSAGPLMGSIFDNWERIAGERRTVIFTASVIQAMALRDQFQERGIATDHVDATTPQRSGQDVRGRDQIFEDLRTGDIQVLTNCGVCRVGWDAPWVECGVLAYSTLSHVMHVQTCGRLFRKHPGKEDAIVIDHGGNVARLGWPTDDYNYELNPREDIEKRVAEERGEAKEASCGECGYVWENGIRKPGPCPNCGHQFTRKGIHTLFVDAKLREQKRPDKVQRTPEQKAWDRCLGMSANIKGGSARQARMFFYRDTGYWPPNNLRNWLSHDATRTEADSVFNRYRRKSR